MVRVEVMACWVGCSVRVQREMSMSWAVGLVSSMKEFVGLVLVPVRNSLILIGLMLRTVSVVVSVCRALLVGLVHAAMPIRSPVKLAGPEVTLKVALTLAPGATESNVIDVSVVPGTKEVHCLLGTEMLSFTPAARDPVVFVNV